MIRSQAHRQAQPGVYVSKTLVAVVGMVGALALGWLGDDIIHSLAATPSGSSALVPPLANESSPSGQAAGSNGDSTNVYLTVVNVPGAAGAAPKVVRTKAIGTGSGAQPRSSGSSGTGSGTTPSQPIRSDPVTVPSQPTDTSPFALPGWLKVGGDGIDDLSARVDGYFNVSTYDDSNVVLGGTGDVNAQIGDSDTGGTVTMDTIDSTVSGGNSR